MSFNDISNLFMFAGGLGMFLYGMHALSNGLEKSAGNKMKQLLGVLTNNHFVAMAVGALVTAIIQSSGATTVMVVGFVNAGIMSLTQAVGTIMGANVGTCITAWIVSLGQLGDAFKAVSPSLYAPLIVGIGAFLIMFCKKPRRNTIGEILIGLGLLFIGLDFMSSAFNDYLELPFVRNAFLVLGRNPLLGMAIGVIVTAIMQSSSASVGVLQTIAATGGVVTTSAAMYISLGANIGSCCTALLSSVGESRDAKRAAVIHLSFNVISAVIGGTVLFIVFRILPDLGMRTIGSVGISIFHTAFKTIWVFLLTPFSSRLIRLSGRIVKERPQVNEANDYSEEKIMARVDERMLKSPSFAVQNGIQEVMHMGNLTQENMETAFSHVLDYDEEALAEVCRREKAVNGMEKILTEYLVKVSNLDLTQDQRTVVNDLFYSVSDIERVGTHVANIAALMVPGEDAEPIVFSEEANRELQELMDIVLDAFRQAMKARKEDSLDAANMVSKYEDMVDSLEEELREKHIERLSGRLCAPGSGVVFLDILNNLERIADHSYNLAGYVTSER